MTDNELVDLCVTCGCILTFSSYGNAHFKLGDDIDMTLKRLHKSTAAVVLLPTNFHWCYGASCTTSNVLFAISRVTGNSSWRISSSYPRIIIKEFVDEGGFLDSGLITTSLENANSQAKFVEQVNNGMSIKSLKDLVFSIVRDCIAKTKELRRTEILASSKEWN